MNSPIKMLVGGICLMIVSMGIGRFAYTPILPVMQNELGLSDLLAGQIASANFLGYLLGALAASYIPKNWSPLLVMRLNLVFNILSLVAMGLTIDPATWSILRFVSGFSSALIFVLTSGWCIQSLNAAGKVTWFGWLLGGMGMGIAISGIVVPPFAKYWGWSGTWFGLTVISVILLLIAWVLIEPPQSSFSNQHIIAPKFRGMLPWLSLAYFLEGLGYIVTGTFLVVLLKRNPAMAAFGDFSWTLVGIAAIPSCVMWARLAARIGLIHSLALAYGLQAIGIILPLISKGSIGAFGGAVLYGGTFLGIVTMTLTLGRELSPHHPERVMGLLTASFGLGQIVGPIAAGYILEQTGTFELPLSLASLVVVLGILFLYIGQMKARSLKTI